MSEAPRIFPGGTMAGMEIRPLTAGQRETWDLLDLEEAGYRIFRQDDFDRRYAPWLVAKDDETIWMVQHGMPASGVNRESHAVLVDDDLRWGFLVTAKASGVRDTPAHVGELERRAAKATDDAKSQRAAQEQRLRDLRKHATPVTLGDLDPTHRMTLAEAHERVLAAGGKVELRKDGELVVALPPTASGWGGAPLHAAKVLYTADSIVADCLREGRELPDREPLPSGALA